MNSPALDCPACTESAAPRYLDCGEGTLTHPVTGRPITTHVVELSGFGRIFEVFDYSGDPERTMALILKGPEMLAGLKQAVALLEGFTRGGRPFVPAQSDPVWAQAPLLATALTRLVAQAENR